MKKQNPPFTTRKTVKGRTYWYFRKGETYTRLPGDPDTEAFSVAYWALRNGSAPRAAPTCTWDALIVSYYKSPSFLGLAAGTKKNYRRHCEAIREKNGGKDMRVFRRKHAIAARDALAGTWSKANERVAVLSILCKHAADLEWIERNPVVDVAKLSGGEYRAWPDAKLRAFENAARSAESPIALTAFELAVGTGQRIGDCIKMRWEDFDGEAVRVIQEKTKEPLWVACPQRLREYLATLPRAGEYILARDLRRPLGKRRVQAAIEGVRAMIGAKGGADNLVPHGWRYTAAQELAEAGCSDSEIQAVTGHRTLEMVQKYRRGANQRETSIRAQARREQNKNKT